MKQYPAGKTQEVSTAPGVTGYWRVYSERRTPKSGDYQRVKFYGDVYHCADALTEAFTRAGFVNVRDTTWGIAADYPL